MSGQSDKSNTGTMELANVRDKLAKFDSNEDGTDPAMKANKESSQKQSESTRVLLNVQQMLKDANQEDADEGIEFSAATAILQLPSDLKESMRNTSTEDATVQLGESGQGINEEQLKKIKLKYKKHYVKKARVLEAQISKLLEGFKTNNPTIQQRIAKIKELLAVHAARKKVD